MAKESRAKKSGSKTGQKIKKEESQMKYLEIKDGVVVVVNDEPRQIKEGDRVRLFRDDGKCLFTWEDRNGKPDGTDYKVADIVDGNIRLLGFTFGFWVTINEGNVKDGVPLVRSICDSGHYGDHDFMLESTEIVVYPNARHLEGEDGKE
jgi:hypothetical protein